MTRSRRSLARLSGTLILVLSTASVSAQRGIGVGLANAPGITQPTHVDCDAGESLQAAIDAAPLSTAQITIDIHGFCQEQITIERKVLIRGTNSQTDGIAGPSSMGNNTALVVVYGVNGFGRVGSETVRFEHLTIKDSSNIGLSVNLSQLGLDDVTIRNNGNIGLAGFTGSFVAATNLSVTDNTGSGLFSRSNLSCRDCVVTGNGGANSAGIAADLSGKIVLSTTTLTSTTGLRASSGGEIVMFGGTISATQRAISVQSAGRVFIQDGTQVTGSVVCSAQGFLDSRRGLGTAGLIQTSTASGGNNQITNGCLFLAGPGTTTLAGQTTVSVGSYAATEGGNQAVVRYNSLNCSTGGKVTTTGGSIFVNNVPGIPVSCGT